MVAADLGVARVAPVLGLGEPSGATDGVLGTTVALSALALGTVSEPMTTTSVCLLTRYELVLHGETARFSGLVLAGASAVMIVASLAVLEGYWFVLDCGTGAQSGLILESVTYTGASDDILTLTR
jgi:hypothetical protein